MSGSSGLSLEFLLKTLATDPDMTARLEATESGLRYRYDALPESERLFFDFPGSGANSLEYLQVTSGSAASNNVGLLTHTAFSENMPKRQQARLASILEHGLKALNQFSHQAFATLEDDAPVLIVSHPDHAVITFYSTGIPLKALGEVVLNAQWQADVSLFQEHGHSNRPAVVSEGLSERDNPTKQLQLITVSVAYKEPFTKALLEYLGTVTGALGGTKLRTSLLKAGQSGETAWKREGETKPDEELTNDPDEQLMDAPLPENSDPKEPVRVDIPSSTYYFFLRKENPEDKRPVIDISHVQTVAEVLAHLNAIVEKILRGDMIGSKLYPDELYFHRFLISPNLVSDTKEALKSRHVGGYAFNTYPLNEFERGKAINIRHNILCLNTFLDNLLPANQYTPPAEVEFEPETKSVLPSPSPHPQTPAAKTLSPEASLTSRYSVQKTMQAFSVGAAVGGGIHLGMHIHNKYRRDAMLPHHYDREAWKALATDTFAGGVRQGISGAAAQNLIDAGFTPASAAVATGLVQSVYDNYSNGNLFRFGLISTLVHSGASSVAAGMGAQAGRMSFAALPYIGKTPPVQLAGSMTGSVVGQMLYHYVTNNSLRYED
ncbi:hypothetical protein [Sansalvadorimonas verongulae]|uniref:hypothetical protein n=1 Tax=Sansalvadorimonas verongulae TaxID=2172824 RepID=UPI0012BBC547|nr:hypothetical protein [Sansalvadorimonas verongulae]MTI12552.1 hypothetical protein [Sansalvadorimonas verongulae]